MTTPVVQQINRAEAWQIAYQAFQAINFAAWDYDSIKKSLLDYLKTYYTEEDFNDYIESSELVLILELFAYMGEMIAYRQDMNAHENIIQQADRKESILRLAKGVCSYNASRNIPARGLVKLISVSTTETIYDSNGNNLTGSIINWNDRNNSSWKDQFLQVMNRVLNQPFGSVKASDRTQVQDIIFELYPLNNNPITNNVISYKVSLSGSTYPMELVSAALDASSGPYESRPELNSIMNLLYLSDGLGDASDNTGFFFYTKQGTLQLTTTTFDGILPNQTFDINLNNINNIDVWVNNVDPTTGAIIVGNGTTESPSGAWIEVDTANSQNIMFNTNSTLNKYEIQTLDNDNVRLIFGDGNFAAIPSGQFHLWTRVSANEDLVIPANAIQNINASIKYTDTTGTTQTFSFSFSLTDSIQNAAVSEDMDHIQRVAPSYYYSQNRMVNGPDYNNFMLQDNSILKLNAINRTFAGDSKYIAWHDPKEYYDNVKVFGDDGVIYFNDSVDQQQIPPTNLPQPDYNTNTSLVNAIINNYIIPILGSDEFYSKSILEGVTPTIIRTYFTDTELTDLSYTLSSAINAAPKTVYLNYNTITSTWDIYTTEPTDYWISIETQTNLYWLITFYGTNIMFHSDSVEFWTVNNDIKTITYDSQNPSYDEIVVLSANVSPSNTIVGANHSLIVVEQYNYGNSDEQGLYSINDLIITPNDDNGDGIPDNIDMSYIMDGSTWVYFNRTCNTTACEWTYMPYSDDVYAAWQTDQNNGTGLWKRNNGQANVNFLWMHRTPKYHIVDPSPSNIIDMYIITRGYYSSVQQWLNGELNEEPDQPTGYELRSDYATLIESKMISDTVLLQSGSFKYIFGQYATNALRASLKVVRTANTTLTDNQVKTQIVGLINSYFDINNWDFGQTFYFTDMVTYISNNLSNTISSMVPVPLYNSTFGALFQIYAREDEIILPSISVDDIDIVTSLDPVTLMQF